MNFACLVLASRRWDNGRGISRRKNWKFPEQRKLVGRPLPN